MKQNSKQILTDDLMDGISKEINSKKQKKVLQILNTASNNQKLTGEAKINILDLLHDNKKNNDDDRLSVFSSESDIIDEEERFNLVYEILDKRQEDLNKDEKNIFELEKNTRNIKSNDESKISESLNNISEIVKKGYNINKHTEKEIIKLIVNEDKNESIIENSTNIINNMVVNNNEISKDVSKNVINKIKNSSNKFSKKSLEQLLACLVNIIDNCNVPEGAVETFENCIKNLNSGQSETHIDLAITGWGILAKKHYSINKESIDICLNIIQNNYLNEQSLKKFSDNLNLIFYQTNVEKSTFNELFNLMIKFN